MKATWITQAGLVFEADGKRIIIDPYLSNSCFKVNPKSNRRIPVDYKYFEQDYGYCYFYTRPLESHRSRNISQNS